MESTPSKFSDRIRSLGDQLEQLKDQKEKETVLTVYLREFHEALADRDKSKPIEHKLLQGGGEESFSDNNDADGENLLILLKLVQEHNLIRVYLDSMMSYSQSMAEKPLERLPCANVEPAKDWRCSKDGRMTCRDCKLVSYCSKECQRKHWRTHKQDCKDPIRSPGWQPAWIRENRDPSFASSSTDWTIPRKEKEFALGLHVWGNIPAVDTLNLAKNEGTSATKSNIALAYVASGDLRNVVRTVNELPSNYSGKLTILLNDREPTIVLRNMLLLMILGTIPDTSQAADIGLHFWGSAFIQTAHQFMLSKILMKLGDELRNSSFSLKLGEKSAMTGVISPQVLCLLTRMLQLDLQLEDASAEIQRIRFEPTRQDRHHRGYCRLEPSHRLASLEYRRFCIILPFGAANNNFNTTNKFLFSPNGKWLSDDLATPLGSWNIEDVIAVGKAHGVQSADLYGCLYFYLTKQLRSFAERIKKFRILFRMFDQDARELAKNIRTGVYEAQGLMKSMAFDRIDVSNIIDLEYVGVANVLTDWTPFLSKTNKFSTILGYSMNWVPKQHNSDPGENSNAMSKITKKLMEMGKLGPNTHPGRIPAYWKYYVALYDNSSAFDEYLAKHHTDEAARKVGVKRKSKHSVVPHRIGATIGAPSNALPQFSTDDSWYLNVQVCSALLSERFVEFAHI